jgi:UDP-N-acetylmuramoyl-tripeptide--D-alanyl-D-alanine ligase
MRQKLAWLFLNYIRILAKLQLAKINLFRKVLGKEKIKIVGITGSAGKTSTMLATVAALKDYFQVKYSKRANSESGIPLNILGLRMRDFSLQDWFRVAGLGIIKLFSNWKNYDVYIVEMGVDEPEPPKNMGYLLRILRPDIGIFTSVTPVHAMQFEETLGLDSSSAVQEFIADEKAKLISALPDTGYAVLNFDDPLVKERKKLTLAKVIGVGENDDSQVKLIDYQVDLKGTSFKYSSTDENNRRSSIILDGFVLPKAYGINFGLVLGVAEALNVDFKDATKGIVNYFSLPPGRSSLINGIKDTYIIDSSYNASPAAMETMLDLLNRLGEKTSRKKIAVLGDMRELGEQSKAEHEKLAGKAVKAADQIITVGPGMKKYFTPKATTIIHDRGQLLYSFDTAGEAAEYLKNNLEGGELILVKGSQNTIFLEIVVQALMSDPSQAKRLLCRCGEYWEEKRKNFI